MIEFVKNALYQRKPPPVTESPGFAARRVEETGCLPADFVIWLTPMGSQRSTGIIEKKVLIQASPAVIYRALTDAKDLGQWFCDRATAEPRVGGELRAYWRAGNEGQPQRGRAVFTRLVQDSAVEVDWVDEGGAAVAASARHFICYTIRLKHGSSEVTVRDEGPPIEDDEVFELLDQGWITVLRDLKEHCESRQRSARRRPSADPEGE
jgi:uncharacterized protein YndB with AHSA1/START domain